DLRSKTISQITHDSIGYFMPDWSPTGREIAFMSGNGLAVRRFDTETNLFSLDLESRTIRQLTHGPYLKSAPAWSPDGKLLAYIAIDNGGTFARGSQGVYVTGLNGEAPSFK